MPPRGFALPAAILALVAVGLLITGGIQLALRQRPMTISIRRATQAFYVAETGVNTVLSSWSPEGHNLRVWGPPRVQRGTTGQGEWEAEIRRVGDQLFFIRATGRVGSGPGASSAKRAVGVAARAQTARFEVPAALQTLGPVELSGSARIVGEDVVPEPWRGSFCPGVLQDLPAIVTPGGTSVEGAPLVQAGATPALFHVRDPSLSSAEFNRLGGMSWEDLTSLSSNHLPGGIIDAVGPKMSGDRCDDTDPMNWGDPGHPEASCGGYFPIIHLQGDVAIRSSGWGQGILLADGDLDLGDEFQFFGLVIAQGSITLAGGSGSGPSVFGAVSTRSRRQVAQRFTGEALLQNSTCAVRRAVDGSERLSRVRPLAERGWVDLTGVAL